MNTVTKKILFWSPRVLCILVSIFLSMLSLDEFNEGYGAGKTILALLIHLVPVYIIVIMLLIAWRWEGIGTILFIAVPSFYLGMNKGDGLIISAPLILVGLLFFVNRIYRPHLKTNFKPPVKQSKGPHD